MNPRNFQLAAVGTIFFLAGTIMIYCTSFEPDSAYAGYALAMHFGGLAIASIGINDHYKQARKQQARRRHPAGNNSPLNKEHNQRKRENA